jgi:L,D-peptidoglycan transpeptidase YkuD (ErfK/YbiS/YcfS/YnhG family)
MALACLLALAACGSAATSVSPTTNMATTSTTTADIAPAAATVPATQLTGVGSAGQAIVVTAPHYGATTAALTAYQRTADGWELAFGPWSAHVGSNGLAPPGQKREGDGRTPSGVYGFDFLFGVQPDPGVRFPYRRVTGPSIVWDDDPASPLYNLWVDSDRQTPGADPEAMYQPVAYAYGAVIAYNTARTPGLGSAIFLHVSTGQPTAGCVSLPAPQVLDMLRWLDPGLSPRIVMGVG